MNESYIKNLNGYPL